MKKIWIVAYSEWDAYEIYGIYTTLKAAEALKAKLEERPKYRSHKGIGIDEFPLDKEIIQ